MRLLEEQVAWVWMGKVRLVAGLVKDRLMGCMGQVLQRGLWQGREPGVGRGGRETRLVLSRSWWRLGCWKKIASGGIREEDMVTFFEDTPQRTKTRVVGGDKGTNWFGFG